MSSAQALIRTQATSIMGAEYLNTDASIWVPSPPGLSKGFIRQESIVTAQQNNYVPGAEPSFQLPRDTDLSADWMLRGTLGTIAVAQWNGGATFARYVDFPALSHWSQVEVFSGTQKLQRIRPEEIMLYISYWLSAERRRNALQDLGSGTPAQRSARALAPQEVACALYTCLGFRLHGDPGQSLYIRGLNDLLTVRVQVRPANEFIETDGTIPTAPANGFLQDWRLVSTGYHVNNSEKQLLAACYKAKPFSLHMDDQQYDGDFVIPAGTALPSVFQDRLRNVNQPVTALFFIARWEDDLTRLAGGANGTRGRDLWNWSGYFNPGGGATNSIIESVQLRTGNNDILSAMPIERMIQHQHYRDFRGDANVAAPGFSLSHEATAVNAVYGFLSFDQIEQPQFILNLRVPTLGTAHATVGAAANADIGVGAGEAGANLHILWVAFTKNRVDQANFLLSRPFN